jgi:ferrous iron transport protein B
MGLMFAIVIWLTVTGANVPSGMLNDLLIGQGHPWLISIFNSVGAPNWITGLLVDGVYLATAWVISVMLPPMAIFFPLFTLLEDYGYLPRVAFNLDRGFRWAGADGKQSLTMMMGFGCNAAGIVATRIIQSPRERLVAIITNNFSICNGRWPTLILMGTIFVASTAPAALAGVAAAGSVLGIAILGIVMTLIVSRVLSRTVLKGEVSHFSLELPPYRPPQLGRVIVRSIFDRTLIVLWRAVTMAAPAGALIWIASNVTVGGSTIASWFVGALDPVGVAIGLNGVILAAYVFAIPANEIIIPTILMLTLNLARSGLAQQGVMLELDETATRDVLVNSGGWTLLTGVNLMLFSLMHNPCSTTIMTIYRETKSVKWTLWATLLPIGIGFAVCALVAMVWRFFS